MSNQGTFVEDDPEKVWEKLISMSELMFYESAPGNVNGNAVT